MINISLDGVYPFISEDEIAGLAPRVLAAHRALFERTGPGAEYTGWVGLPESFSRGELERVAAAAEAIPGDEALVVIGIGGSYLGAKAAVELLRPGQDRVIFAGNSLSPEALLRIADQLKGRDFRLNVVSKSGGTLEPALAFRFFRELLAERYGGGADERIIATTDENRGVLHDLAAGRGWTRFTVPDDVGGRYSVLTAVGLLPMAAAGIDIRAVMKGARAEMGGLSAEGMENPAWRYAAARYALYGAGKKIELLAAFEPSMRWFLEWYRQLFGESEGKGGRGVFPATAEYSADLHSLGQYVQDGERTLFETVVAFEEASRDVIVPDIAGDGLDTLAGKSMSEISRVMQRAVRRAHISGGVPCIDITVPRMDEAGLGALMYFFEFSCGLSGYLLGVNPFDQPGVEDYKRELKRELWI